jgi:hypothetical protein
VNQPQALEPSSIENAPAVEQVAVRIALEDLTPSIVAAFADDICLIWSGEHQTWWLPGSDGYTARRETAGAFTIASAYERTKHCGPEKRIAFERVPATRHPAATGSVRESSWWFNEDTRDIECGGAPVFRVYEAADFPCIEDEDRTKEDEYFDAQAQTAVLMLNSLLHDSGDTTPVATPAQPEATGNDGAGWQDIATAPKDGSRLDLWIIHPGNGGRRYPDSFWDDAPGDWKIGQYHTKMYVDPPAVTHWMRPPAPPAALAAQTADANTPTREG